jgi:hypothetical protein
VKLPSLHAVSEAQRLTPEDWNELRALFAKASAAGSDSYAFDNSQSAGA